MNGSVKSFVPPATALVARFEPATTNQLYVLVPFVRDDARWWTMETQAWLAFAAQMRYMRRVTWRLVSVERAA